MSALMESTVQVPLASVVLMLAGVGLVLMLCVLECWVNWVCAHANDRQVVGDSRGEADVPAEAIRGAPTPRHHPGKAPCKEVR